MQDKLIGVLMKIRRNRRKKLNKTLELNRHKSVLLFTVRKLLSVAYAVLIYEQGLIRNEVM